MAALPDTNIYHRCGPEVAAEVRDKASELAEKYPDVDLESLNRDFIARRISPGGSADMLALWFFLRSLLCEN